MLCNTAMLEIITAGLMDIDLTPNLLPAEYSIWQQKNQNGDPYWGIGRFGGGVSIPVDGERDLTELEWDGNEILLFHSKDGLEENAKNHADICKWEDLMANGLGILASWKKQMELQYPKVPFDILLSLDCGDEDVSPSVTLRFWAVRNEYHIIAPSTEALEQFKCNPLLMENINYKPGK